MYPQAPPAPPTRGSVPLCTPSRALGEPPGPAKPESRLSASAALSFNFSSSTYPCPLLPPRTLAPHAAGAGHPPAARPIPLPHVWLVSPYGTDGCPGRHPHTLQSLSGRPARTTFCGCEPRVPTTLTARPAPLLRTLSAANGACALPPPPSRVGAWSLEPGADGKSCGKRRRRGPGALMLFPFLP